MNNFLPAAEDYTSKIKRLILSKADVEAIYKGASVFSTGGGFILEEQNLWYPPSDNKLELISVDSLNHSDLVCGVFVLGSAARATTDLIPVINIAIDRLQALFDQRFAAIFPVETGIDSATFKAATILRLPILDADVVGGRAVPEMSCDNFYLEGKFPQPLVAVDEAGSVSIIKTAKSSLEIEEILTHYSKNSRNGLVFCADHVTTACMAAKHLTLGTISRSLQSGQALV